MPKSAKPKWDIRNEGRAWKGEEAFERYMLTLLAPLLENVGADRAVRRGEPEVWRAAVAKLPR